ncbi:MAG: prepilin-type N-terminal cleavage/methylation domain-containing protein [Armatimonadetes bacterium]|nr:prepilin-type N-terminal cleavage/methylation domain-containing protein [Armatimonadota bacterium]
MRRGFTLMEVMASVLIVGMVVLGSVSMLASGLYGFTRATTDAELATTNARSIRHIADNLRNAASITVTNSGTKVTYTLPLYTGANDPVTGEKELVIPIQSDGIVRSYSIDFAKGTMTDSVTGKVVLKKIASVDPDPKSTQYKQAYTPFQLVSVGSNRALTINLITLGDIVGEKRYMRFKTTVIGHNVK